MSVNHSLATLRRYYLAGIAAGSLLTVGLVALIINASLIRPRPSQSEAKTNLGAIFTAQTYYFGEHQTYAAGPDCVKLIGWRPEGDTLYSYYCGNDEIACTKHGCISCDAIGELPALPESSTTGFTIYAVGNVDRDSADCDVWSMNDAKALKNNVNDIAN